MKVLQTIPILRIFDEAKAREFYVGFLGFKIDWEHRLDDTGPLFMQVSRDGCTFHLSEHHGDACPGSAVNVNVTGLREYHREIMTKGYGYMRPGIERQPWNSDVMTVIDPFGARINFSEDVAAES